MRVVGIDPGIYGALAVIDDSVDIHNQFDINIVFDLPVEEDQGGRNMVNFYETYKLIRLYAPDLVMLEHVHAMPRQGVSSTFRFGMTFGGIIAVLSALELRYVLVHSTVWKRRVRVRGDKQASVARAIELYPEAAPYLARKMDHNRAEAILIAHYGLTHVVGS